MARAGWEGHLGRQREEKGGENPRPVIMMNVSNGV